MLLIIFSTRNSSLFLINDDVLIDHILSGRTFNVQGDVPPFISFILSKFINVLYAIFGTKLSIYGIFLFIINFLITIIIFNLTINSKNKIKVMLGFSLIIILLPTLFYSPTFTITAFLALGVGVLGLISYLDMEGKNFYIISFLIMVIVAGFLIRPPVLFGFTLFFGLFIVQRIIFSNRTTKVVSLITTLIIVLVFLIEKILQVNHLNKSIELSEYFKFTDLRAGLSFTNAIFKAQQLVIDGLIPNSPFSKVDFLLLLNWFNLDSSKFNFNNLNYVISYVDEFIGLKALFQLNIADNFNRLLVETSGLNKFWICFVTLIIILMGKYLLDFQYMSSIFLLFIGFLGGFYYLSAAGRLPYRTIFPIAILLLFSIFLFKEFNLFIQKKKVLAIIITFLTLFVIDFHYSNYFGFIQINKNNNSFLSFYKSRDYLLHQFIQNNRIIIAPIDVLPISIQGTSFKNIEWKSSKNSIPVDWTVGSPSWVAKVDQLGVLSNNVFISLAKNKNVYFVGSSDTAHLIEYFMNDNSISRGKLCSITNLNGLDVFTYQAKENDC